MTDKTQIADGKIQAAAPDVLRVHLFRLAASSIWLEDDFVRGWFWTLWLRLATNESEPGYLRLDRAQLYRAAGARSAEYFEKHSARMLEQNFRWDDLGRFYCTRLLQELEDSRMNLSEATRGSP
jgi:hypothetical protein